MADIAIQEVPVGGLDSITFTAAAASQTVPANSGTRSKGGWEMSTLVALLRNTNAATRDVTIGAESVTVPVTTGVSMLPVPDPGINGAAQAITYSATANLEIALLRIGA